MNLSKTDIIAFLLITIIPLACILLEIFLALKEKLILSFIIPVLWTALGIWMIAAIYRMGDGFSSELVIFFSGGDILLACIAAAARFIRRRKRRLK